MSETEVEMEDEVRMVLISEIHADPDFNCRGAIAPIDVVDLAKDIQQNGLLQPVVISPYNEERQIDTGFKFKLIMGFRRHKAHQINESIYIQAKIKDVQDDRKARILNLSENVKRKDLNIVQEANALRALKNLGATQEDVSMELGMSKGWVQVRFMLLDLPEEIHKEAAADMLTQYQIRELYSLRGDKEALFAAVKKIKTHKLSGSKGAFKPPKKKKATTKKQRTKTEIVEMMQHFQGIPEIGNGLWTRALAWAAGEINDYEMYASIKEYADLVGVNYEIPEEILSSV